MIEITGTNTGNKGAELMLCAILEKLRAERPGWKFSADSSLGSDFEHARYELYHQFDIRRPGRSWLAMQFMPKSFRVAAGLANASDTHVVIDASGFAFGLPHPLDRIRKFAEHAERAAGAGKPVILMPQAFGRMDEPAYADCMRRIARAARLIFAREPVSLEFARAAAGPYASKIELAPDFTNLLSVLPQSKVGELDRVCIVPNVRMHTDARSPDDAKRYLPMLVEACRAARAAGSRPVVLVHDSGDHDLAEQLVRLYDGGLEVVAPQSPLDIKREIGRSRMVVASRFHALVSALAQGVPVIATSWSHKYEQLLADYGCEDMLLKSTDNVSLQEEMLKRGLGEGRNELLATIQERGRALRVQTEGMWMQVLKQLEEVT